MAHKTDEILLSLENLWICLRLIFRFKRYADDKERRLQFGLGRAAENDIIKQEILPPEGNWNGIQYFSGRG